MDVTRRVSVRIDELVVDRVDEGEAAAELVAAEVKRVLARQPVPRPDRVAAQVGRAVDGSVGSC